MPTNLMRDLRYGARMMRRAPGWTLVVVLTLTLGIGASTAIFSVVYGVLIRPLPYRDPAASILLARVLSAVLYGINPADGVPFGLASVLLLLVAAGACYLPARRASGIDPSRALRAE